MSISEWSSDVCSSELNVYVLFLEDIARDAPMVALDKITTGSFSLLFAICLGYRDVFLMGVDLDYVEKLPEAELKGGRVLEIKSDPEDNPNYFFDDYQQIGRASCRERVCQYV